MEGFDYQYFWRLFGTDPFWLTQMIVFVSVAYTCCVFGVVFGKMGRSPFWGFIFLPPFFGVIATWIFGLGRWPQTEIGKQTNAASLPVIPAKAGTHLPAAVLPQDGFPPSRE